MPKDPPRRPEPSTSTSTSTSTKSESIFHLVEERGLLSRIRGDFFHALDLERDGFVHCALAVSVLSVADDYFGETRDRVLLLEIDPSRLSAEVRYEAPAPIAGGGRDHLSTSTVFPHVYGPIESRAIVGVGTLDRGPEGYRWPSRFETLPRLLACRGQALRD